MIDSTDRLRTRDPKAITRGLRVELAKRDLAFASVMLRVLREARAPVEERLPAIDLAREAVRVLRECKVPASNWSAPEN